MQNIIKNFKKLCEIPHCSYETNQMRDFLNAYAKEKNFKVNIDLAGNIHCIKGNPKICLQSHYDMVCMGNAPKIEVYEDNGYLKAKDSSLGADNGIGIAIMLEAMQKFSNLECLFTNNEEVGLMGVNDLEHKLHSKMLLNLDHENENEIIIGCAGGVDIEAFLEYETKEYFGKVYELSAINFNGGHSGIDIIDNPKSSIKEMARFIKENKGKIINFEGGERVNSIPKYAKALVLFDNDVKSNKYIHCQFIEERKEKICLKSDILLNLLISFSQGVRSFNKTLDIVQTSINLAILKMNEQEIRISLFARSNLLEDLKQVEFETLTLFEAFNFKARSFNFYPPWEGKENELSDNLLKIFKKENKNIKISAIHAGLECGIIEKKQKILCCSIGPNIYNPHSTDERCELASVERISKIVFELLKNYQ
ncbi:M20/M25/M40 family metallo-hydrolase [Campylobacter sp. 2018MI35]|uniref:M20/M25/M40 family metallo-hydrolase n=1 Tax=Campylobacter sp. 2018MI34 TaxID=2800582 RepID=UPI001907DABA|nr:M20/M25/M40 family metallo-hydrolase [Campylobacter sp. 2018MI34]MBK1991613.1 M20/M25/M40 family metallo-hydrolase [Campylobacter sp. 2018MI34]